MTTMERVAPRLKQRYRDEIKPALRDQFSYGNVMQIPGVVKVVVNMGVGDAAKDSKLIEGANRIKKHTKITQSTRGAQQGGIITQEAPVHVSNVQVVCPSCGKPSRIGHRRSEADANGKTHSVRICRRCNGDI